MKNKKGFTLIEILGAIAILAVLVVIAIPVYNKTADSTRKKAYVNKSKQIELAAEKWASENNLSRPQTITVNYLVDEGYFQADSVKDDKAIVNNPTNNKSMLCYTIDITMENATPNAKLNDTENCSLVVAEEVDKNITVTGYRYDTVTKKIASNNFKLNNKLKTLDWTNTDVLLVVESSTYSNFTKVMYSSGGSTIVKNVDNNLLNSKDIKAGMEIDLDKYANVYSVSASLFLKNKYDISLYTNEGTKNTDVMVQIDRQPASASTIGDDNWSKDDKKVIVQGTDGNGSGLKGFYISDNETFSSDLKLIETKYDTTIVKKEGTYYIWTLDVAGNISDKYSASFVVKNIDRNAPVIGQFVPNFTKVGNYKYNQKGYIDVSFSDNESGVKIASYCLTNKDKCEPNINMNLNANFKTSVKFPTSKDANRLCVKVLDNVGNESVLCDTKNYLVDMTVPVNTSIIYNQNRYMDKLIVKADDPDSGISHVVCRYGIGNLSSSSNASKSGDEYLCNLGLVNSKQNYKARADIYNNAGEVVSTSTINFQPSITPEDAYKKKCGTSNYCDGDFVKYGNFIFNIYKKSGNTYWAILNKNYGRGKVINAWCCDCSCCYYHNANLGSDRNSLSSAIESFYNELPVSKSTKLTSVFQYTGYAGNNGADYTSDRGWTSPFGLLNYTDWLKIKYYSLAKSDGEYALSTVVKIINSYSNNAPSPIMVNGSSIRFTSNPLAVVSARPIIIINGSIPFDGGNGTASNPYIMR